MTIRQLSLTDFRNLRSTTLDFDARINLIHGDNGSGKTSLLEAIYVICQGQSFRTHQLRQCIRHGEPGFLLFARFADFKAGLSRTETRLEIHVNGEVVNRRSELVKRVPVNIVNADSFALIEGAPQKRRAFLDWCLFHVEHSYADAWSEYRHALRQRNRLLKNRRDLQLLDYWDDHLVEPSMKIHSMRQQLCRELRQIIEGELEQLLQGLSIDLELCRGWSEEVDLKQALEADRQRDIRSGFTASGIHRDDLVLKSNDIKVDEVLSRGQSKRLCLALLLAALKLVGQKSGKRIVLLIDDLNSELDADAREKVYSELRGMDLQLFISNIDSAAPAPLGAKEFKMFHVEHGTIKPRNFS